MDLRDINCPICDKFIVGGVKRTLADEFDCKNEDGYNHYSIQLENGYRYLDWVYPGKYVITRNYFDDFTDVFIKNHGSSILRVNGLVNVVGLTEGKVNIMVMMK